MLTRPKTSNQITQISILEIHDKLCESSAGTDQIKVKINVRTMCEHALFFS